MCSCAFYSLCVTFILGLHKLNFIGNSTTVVLIALLLIYMIFVGSAVGFRLDSLLKLTDTRAKNNKMTLMHYLCKVNHLVSLNFNINCFCTGCLVPPLCTNCK